MEPTSPSHECNPYSEESLRIVEQVEHLPFDEAFEAMLYENRLDRVARFEYQHKGYNEYDPSPLHIDPDVMTTRFPNGLRGIFPETDYIIEQLKIEQTDPGFDFQTKRQPGTTLSVSFYTHDAEHLISVKENVALYETKNNELENVAYTLNPEDVVGLIAAFVYAQQYNPEHPTRAIELADSSLDTLRDPRVEFTEQLIMTLGNFNGESTLQTRAVFEDINGAPIVATLVEQEVPDRSFVSNKLILSELLEIESLTTASETLIKQSIVTISQDEATSALQVPQLTSQSAELRLTTLTTTPLSATEYIDPTDNYPRWVGICAAFLKAIDSHKAQDAED